MRISEGSIFGGVPAPELGPLATTWQELAYQGGFRVFKNRDRALDDIFLFTTADGEVRARQRIRWVEIETALDEVDVARVNFVDPERRIVGYVADLWNKPNTEMLELWTVKIGYHFLPEEHWVAFSGLPVIEDTSFPRNGPPEVTIRLFDPSVAMQRRNTSGPDMYKPTRHFLHTPHSFIKALEAMAEAYGLQLFLGSLREVFEYLDGLMARVQEEPTETLEEYHDQGLIGVPLPPLEPPPQGVDWPAQRAVVSGIFDVGDKDISDWSYLQAIKTKLQPIVNDWFEAETTGGVHDALWTAVRMAANKVVVGIRAINGQPSLLFCRLRDLASDLDEIVMFSYQTLDHSLLSLQVRTDSSRGGTGVSAGAALNYALRMAGVEPSQSEEVETDVKTGPDDPEARYDVSSEDETYAPAGTAPAGKGTLRIVSAQKPRLYVDVSEEQILGELATNLRAEAELIGAPFLQAGRLIATYGLGPTPETSPTPTEAHRLSSLDRVWVVTRCTHRVDARGLYVTTVELAGASTDDSTKVPAALANILLGTVEPSGTAPATSWLQKIFSFLGF